MASFRFPENAEALPAPLRGANFYFSQVKAQSFIVFSSTLRKQSNFFITNTVFFVFHAAKIRRIPVECINYTYYFTLFICYKA